MLNRRILLPLGVLVAGVVALVTGTTSIAPSAVPSPLPSACNGGTGCSGSTCPGAITAASATLPTQACAQFDEVQSGVDIFSWNEFIALNWPATGNCTADTGKSIVGVRGGEQGPVVWQTQMSADDVFVAPNQSPSPWCGGPALKALLGHRPRAFADTSKAATQAHQLGGVMNRISDPTGVEAVGGVVTDPSGRWLRFERYMNRIEYAQIVAPQNQWYRLARLSSLKSITLPTGSLELKASWKVLTSSEISSGRYYTTKAIVYNTPSKAHSPGPNPVVLGLVGLHIIQKTRGQPGFFWSTFEQVDNDKVFANPGSTAPPNVQTAATPYVELKPNGAPNNPPVPIVRRTKIAADPNLNAYYQKLLGGSVFANYRLVSTQWQTGGAPQGTPPNVANITIETYVQAASLSFGKRPLTHRFANGAPPTGCLGCHAFATTASGNTTTDHSFLFLQAQ